MVNIERIAKLHAAENPASKVFSAEKVPHSYAAITMEWLTDVLCRHLPRAAVMDFQLDAPDDGTTNRRRIVLRYNQAGQEGGCPSSVFCKAASSLSNRLLNAMTDIGRIETDFYRWARPRLDIDAPEALYARHDPETCTYIVMLKDLSGVVRFCDERTDVTFEMAMTQMETLARLHSAFYDDPALGTDALPFPSWEVFWDRMMKLAPDFPVVCDRAFVESEHLMSTRLFARREEIWPATVRSMELQRALPRALCHGDSHLKNWYVRHDDKMGLGDWQVVTAGPWARDLVYTLTCALSIENRRRWEKELIRFYLGRMHELGVPLISFDAAMLLCRQQIFTPLAFWTNTLIPAQGMPDMQPRQTTLEFLRRLFAAIEDHDALDSLQL